ncbi:MAG: response regulator transcription factor [Eggerthellaceae bacterium]|nr:response regulator transcription factor [Eggerthellaceae bacterium]
MPTKILFAEDTEDLNRAVSAILQHEGFEVVSFYDGATASDALSREAFDLVILDIMMPGKSGIEVLRDMRAEGNVTPVLLLTAKAEVDDRVEGLEAGADDYLPKPFAMKELVARVRSLARRNTDYGVGNLSFGDITLDSATFEMKASNGVRLSHLEFELLRTFILNPGRNLSDDFLLGRVWPDDADADASTVALYVRYLNNKLEAVNSSVTLVVGDGSYQLSEGGAS